MSWNTEGVNTNVALRVAEWSISGTRSITDCVKQSLAGCGVTYMKLLWASRVISTIPTSISRYRLFTPVFSLLGIYARFFPQIFSSLGLQMIFPAHGFSPLGLLPAGLYPPALFYPKLFPSSLGSQSLKQAASKDNYLPPKPSKANGGRIFNANQLLKANQS